MNKDKDVMSTGTTTIGLKYKNGVVIAADRRATAGNMIVNPKAKKIHTINSRFTLTTSGTVSDAQKVIKLLDANINVNENRRNRDLLVKEVASMLSSYVYSNIRAMRPLPAVTHFLLAGYDSKGIHLYDVFPDGSLTEIDNFVSSGSGSVFSYGVLESQYEEDMSQKEATDLALNAINTSLRRDSATGNGVEVFIIEKDNIEKVIDKKVSVDVSNN